MNAAATEEKMKPAGCFYSWSKSFDLAWNKNPTAQHGPGWVSAI